MGDELHHVGIVAAAICAMAGLTATTVRAGGAVTTSLFLSLSGTVSTPTDPLIGRLCQYEPAR